MDAVITEKLKNLYDHVALHPGSIGAFLAVYARRNRLEDRELANLLQIDLDTLYLLGLVSMPSSPLGLTQVAEAHGVSPARFFEILSLAKKLL